MTKTLFGEDDGKSKPKKQGEKAKNTRIVVQSKWCDEIYDEYPRHVGVNHAIKSIHNKIRDLAVSRYNRDPRAAYGYLLERTKAYAASQEGHTDRSFIPYPATWFNQGRFNDDPVEWNQWRGPEWYDEQKKKQAAKARVQETKTKWVDRVSAMSEQDLDILKEAVAVRVRNRAIPAELNLLESEGVQIPGKFDFLAQSI